MISSIRPWIKFAGIVIVLVWFLNRLLIGDFIKGKSQERGFRIRRKFCSSCLKILGIKFQKEGQPFPDGCLYVSNHRSMLDPLIELSWIDTNILSKAEVGDYPLLGRGAKETGIILVDRDDSQSRKMALGSIEELLLSKRSVLVYPEGTVYNGDLTGQFRKGAIELAYDLGVPIVPVMIEYPDAGFYWGDEELLQYFLRVFSKAGGFIVNGKIGEPVITASRGEIVVETQNAISKMIVKSRESKTFQV
jgi:1-acyl-sn-glycerol-3-phosphate acyltransferase